MGVEAAGETPSLTGEFGGETHRVLEFTQDHPPGNQHQKGPIHLWIVEEVTESLQRAEQTALFPLRPLPHNTVTWIDLPWQIPKAPYYVTSTPRQKKKKKKNMDQMKEEITVPVNKQLSDE